MLDVISLEIIIFTAGENFSLCGTGNVSTVNCAGMYFHFFHAKIVFITSG
jgi:hypothetical protein